MICEHCGKEQDGQYGSGRFCDSKCARAFSTANKRDEINAKVSKKLRGHKNPPGVGFQKGHDPYRRVFTDEDRVSAKLKLAERLKRIQETIPFDKLSLVLKKRLVLSEQDNRCANCGLKEWLDKPITLELDHISGNRNDNTRENLRCLCPNCHSQTDTYRNKNADKNRQPVLDEDLIDALKKTSSIRQALISVGLAVQHGNYARAKKLIMNI